MNDEIRVRFAPSPTGFLHVGGARTALFNWLYAKAMKGKFLLRIEDTDPTRSEDRFTKDIIESMEWMGFHWDEEPVYQSKRFDRYQKIAKELQEKKLAYKCDCTQEMLDAIRAKCEKEKRPFRYPGTCKNKTQVGENFVVRVQVPKSGETAFNDLIRGTITVQNRDLDDWIILRRDNTPTYNFSVVIDDHDQKVTHILRGDDHINNTPKQILLYQLLGFKVPNFAHLPMILGTDKTKLSKRHGAASTLEYREMGYLPISMINFLVRLGWSHGDQEFFSLDELFQFFNLDKIGKAPAIFNTEKLNWISGHFMQTLPASQLAEYLKKHFSTKLPYKEVENAVLLEKGVHCIQGKVKTFLEMIEQLDVLWGADPEYDFSKIKKEDLENHKKFIALTKTALQSIEFKKENIENAIKEVATNLQIKVPPISQAVRFAVTGGRVSPGLFDMLEAMGKERVSRRLENYELKASSL